MIEIENLSDQNFEEILDTAIKRISQINKGEWTNMQESDPGITLLELFAWLKVVQQNYINRVSNVSQYKFLDMLDIDIKHNKGSNTLLKVSNVKKDMLIPKGTKWLAGDMEFENDNQEYVTYSEVIGADFYEDNAATSVKKSDFNSERTFYIFGRDLKEKKERFFDINFSAPISNGMELSLYFDVALDDVYKRNPISNEIKFFEMAKLSWQLYGEKEGKLGWHEIKVLNDETHNFLFPGIVTLNIDGNMKMLERSFKIRVKLIEEEYDFSPKVKSIRNNVFQVTQKSTLCESYIINKSMIDKEGNFTLYSNLALYGNYIAFIKKGDSWKFIKTIKCKKLIKENKAIFSISKSLINQIVNYTNIEDAILVVAYDKSIESKMILGSGTGIAYQSIKLNYNNILYDSFDIMVGRKYNNEVLFDKWDKVHDLFSSTKDSKDYMFIEGRNLVLFGDNEKALAPKRLKNNIVLVGLALTNGRKSNIKSGVINKVISENALMKELIIEQLNDATGGRNTEKLADVKAKAADVLNAGKHLVTIEDYENAVRSTPGLVITGVSILSNVSNNKDSNSITVVVRGGDKNFEKPLSCYEENVRRYLDKYRLINTKINVISPTYISLDITGEIVINSYYKKSKDIINQSIKDYIEELNKYCGQMLYYGDFFGMLDKLDCISFLDELHISVNGAGVEKNMSDDILIPPNGVYRLNSIDFNYINNSNI